jgi:two-component system, NtrC family, response regulator GlrR
MQTHAASGARGREIAKYRCAIVCLNAAADLVGSLHACLATVPALDLVTAPQPDPIVKPPDAVLFATSPTALSQLLAHTTQLRRERPDCAILVAGSGFGAEHIAALFGAGVHDFVGAPLCGDELWARLQRALGLLATDAAPAVLSAMNPHMRDFIGHSPAFLKQIAKLPTIAGCDAGVLILGETGTGKEVCAQAIHYSSARASKPWIAVNCGAIPLELIESELFGHVRGAYTTAHTSREGLVAEAEGGTLFLDDIDTLPMSAQAKLLRFLQEHEYRAVGANAVRRADVRVIAASNRNLAAVMARGEFRRDLYFRLNVLTLTLPPLRERQEDIPELAQHMVGRFSKKQQRQPPALSPQAVKKLLAHDWPGNVRELQHVIERSLLLSKGPILAAADIDIAGGGGGTTDHSGESFQTAKDRVVEQFERNYIEQLLVIFEGNVTHAAQEAKKNRRAFFELIRKHGIEPQRFRPGHR